MSLFKALSFAAVLLLAGCGFEPMYGTHSAAAKEIVVSRPEIDIDNIPDRDGQYLRNLLIDDLYTHGRPADALFRLRITKLEKNVIHLGIQKDATATRAQVQITAHMALVEKATGKTVLERDLRSFGAYNLLDNQLATIVSEQSITESILQEIESDAVTELDLYFRRRAERKAS